jgi:hypothetical protein
LKVGTVGVVVVELDRKARGVVGEDGLGCGLLKGGGGIAFLSSSSLVIIGTGGSSLVSGGSSGFVVIVGGASFCFFAISWIEGFGSHDRNDQEDGGWR